jgi:hypothetical protein
MRTVTLKEQEVAVLFQAIFNEMTWIEREIEKGPVNMRDEMKRRLDVMEGVSKKIMHAKQSDYIPESKLKMKQDESCYGC